MTSRSRKPVCSRTNVHTVPLRAQRPNVVRLVGAIEEIARRNDRRVLPGGAKERRQVLGHLDGRRHGRRAFRIGPASPRARKCADRISYDSVTISAEIEQLLGVHRKKLC